MNTALADLETLTAALETEAAAAPAPAPACAVLEVSPDKMLFMKLGLDLQNRAFKLEKLFAPIIAAGKSGRGARIEAAAAQLGISVPNARKLFDAYREQGLLGLVDGRKRGVKQSKIPRATVEWMRALAEINGANLLRAFEQAVAIWQTQTPWQNKRAIPGYEGYPTATVTGLPESWSYKTFHRLCQLKKMDRTLAKQGLSAAMSYMPLLNRSRKDLHVGQVLMCDDVWHDHNVTRYGTNSELIRPIELCCLDYFSAKKIVHILKPRQRNEETGKWENFRDEHMRYLLAAIFTRIGFHPDGCLLIVEHGTAQVSKKRDAAGEDLEDILHRVSNGLITVQRGAIQDKPAVLGAWGGPKKGNFRIKAALESMHNIPHLWERHLVGATGSDSRNNLPDEHHGRETEHKRLAKAIAEAIEAGLKPEIIGEFLEQLAAPFLPFQVYASIVNELYDIIDRRTTHHLEGWKAAGLFTGEFRLKLDSPEWFPAAMFEKLADSEHYGTLENLMLANKGYYRERPLSPHEVWTRGAHRLVRLPDLVIPQILGAKLARKLRVSNAGEFVIKDGEVTDCDLVFIARPRDTFGYEICLRDGQEYDCFLNPFDLEHLVVCEPSPSGPRFIGVCTRKMTVSPVDMVAVRKAQGQAAHAQTQRVVPYRQRHSTDADEAAAARAQNTAAIKKLQAADPKHVKAAAEVADETAVAATDTQTALSLLRAAKAARAQEAQGPKAEG